MKATAIFLKKTVQVKAVKAGSVIGIVLALTACGNYTVNPVCNEQNAVLPPGLTGTYTLSLQNEDFSTVTQEWDVRYNAAAKKMSMINATGEDEEWSVCSARGMIIQESLNEDLGLYEQQRMVVTGFGLIFAPLFYDRNELTQTGVATHIIEIPARLKKLAHKIASDLSTRGLKETVVRLLDNDEPVAAMVIENSGTDTNAVLGTAKTGAISLNLIRK